ncbi:MAG TPA: peptidase [Algoriphagus sp.]|jgi:tetratricopeptide (TPR) repeat protein|uniref:tetratricopeptide repeat protein n=1 Tax=unclassified Algoriphagus TaxID=2641541 RepID=UPI000C604CED|nr:MULTISPECIES: tetratricopeptide repeat protein [unclassified Algoriphagus]MAL14804.1 peptidase [Algoriphagus sp.]HAH37646.1 peptidase [Algoriphagus sp.]HAS57129.1 peptidase [Algoriphagus sp.]HCB46420.1 peptidase [Algoriphagus sp.]HCD89086.1 peptidase [Algoriphagus sp.]|tara:strand:- start:357 stop:1172 length:816 start_codon:yes stop_codon:yes gene_type:complete
MKKSQLFLIIIGVAAVVALYALPKIVVDNEAQNTVGENQTENSPSTSANTMHENELSPEKEATLAQLKAKAVAGSETISEDMRQLASLYQEKGKYDSAAYFLSLAANQTNDLSLAEETGNAYFEAFTFALDQEKVAYLAGQTRDYLNRVLDNDPTRMDLKSKIAMTYVSSANPMQGIAMLREILAEDPQNEDAIFNMGILSMQSGQYKKATERFEELIRYHPDNLQGQFYLAVSYFEADQKNKAKAQFEKVKGMTQDAMILESVQSYLDRL